MPIKPENQFISGVHNHLPKLFPHKEKMCNPYRGGTPDWWYSGNNGDLWVEYKFVPRVPQRGNVTPNLSELQKQWLKGRYEEGRRVHVVMACPLGGVVLSDREWEAPLTVKTYLDRIRDRKALALWITQITMR